MHVKNLFAFFKSNVIYHRWIKYFQVWDSARDCAYIVIPIFYSWEYWKTVIMTSVIKQQVFIKFLHMPGSVLGNRNT